ncbi:Development/cell death domain - like 2 [Theobroma cacao]|nr:Development/cell death domain - like 2 [Theobroma cacao]
MALLHTPNKTPPEKDKENLNLRAQQEREIEEHDQEELSGFIFMCNGRTKPQCYQYRVFGLPVGKMEVVEKIKPGMKLFLFDFELKLLYGIYEATSVGTMNLEQTAFNGRHAIEHNYQKGFKFNQELNKQQARSLLSLFRPLTVSALGSLQPMQHQAVENQSRLPFLKDSCAQVLESQRVQQIGFQRYNCYRPLLDMSHVHPVMKPQVSLAQVDPDVTGMQLGYVQPVSEPQNILQSAPFQQQHYFGSTTNMGHSNPTTVTQAFLTSNGQLYLAEVQQPYVAGNPTQPISNSLVQGISINYHHRERGKVFSRGGQLQLITDLQSEMMTPRVTIQLQVNKPPAGD